MSTSLALKTLRNTVISAVYIFGVSQLLVHGEKWFGQLSAIGPFVLLLLFSLSAAVVGGLVFGESIRLAMDGKKQDAVTAALMSIGWLAVITVVAFALVALLK